MMKRLALVAGVALAVLLGFLGGRFWTREEGNGWVLWEKTVEHFERHQRESWDLHGAFISLDECEDKAREKGARSVMIPKALKLEGFVTATGKGYIALGKDKLGRYGGSKEFECYPAATDPRPRR
jgi:hypothetical protein